MYAASGEIYQVMIHFLKTTLLILFLMIYGLPFDLAFGCETTPVGSEGRGSSPESDGKRSTDDQTKETEHRQVIVVGAGVSGLAAAKELKVNGYDVVILEARDRIGGRVWTYRNFEGAALDMGAGWIHGKQGNPIYRIAKKLKLPLLVTDYENLELFAATGPLNWRHKKWSELESAIDRSLDMSIGGSVRDAIQPDLSKALEQGDFTQPEVDYFVNTAIEHEYACDVKSLSVAALEEGEEFGGPDVLFPNGYDQITEYLAEGLDIHLDHPVRKIVYKEKAIRVIISQRDRPYAGRICLSCSDERLHYRKGTDLMREEFA